ncbi:hypothetical protein BC827DRAFT_1158060 [Russula dissimulans]|nr:hypothetical protein BC827DRAFT_1158060 [Russula dissimulans]
MPQSTRTFPQAPSQYAGSASRMSSATSNANYAYGGAAPPPQMPNPGDYAQRSFPSPATGYPYSNSSDPSPLMPVPSYQTVPGSNPTYLRSSFGAPERERSISGGSNYPNAYTAPDNPIDSDDENLGEGFAAASTSSDLKPKGPLDWPFSWKNSTSPTGKKRGQATGEQSTQMEPERCKFSGCNEYAQHGDMEWVGFCSNSHKFVIVIMIPACRPKRIRKPRGREHKQYKQLTYIHNHKELTYNRNHKQLTYNRDHQQPMCNRNHKQLMDNRNHKQLIDHSKCKQLMCTCNHHKQLMDYRKCKQLMDSHKHKQLMGNCNHK